MRALKGPMISGWSPWNEAELTEWGNQYVKPQTKQPHQANCPTGLIFAWSTKPGSN